MTGKPDLIAAYIQGLRNANKLTCGIDGCTEQLNDVDERIRAHLLEQHAALAHGREMADLMQECRRRNNSDGWKASNRSGQPDSQAPAAKHSSPLVDHEEGPVPRQRSSTHQQPKAGSDTNPRRSRAASRSTGAADPAFGRRAPQPPGKKLWSPDEPVQSTPAGRRSLVTKPRKGEPPPRGGGGGCIQAPEELMEEEQSTKLIKQPETRPISQDQLIAEVKGIYAGLVMVESKCIEVDNAQSSQNETKLNNEQWQALIALHRTLLHEHHDFFLASQHPSASPALRRLASKYAMPARMWRHGIHSFLELLRHRLPASLEHMLTFIYLAYSMMALLYETVPAFEDTWIECLGDLGRYRMAIEDDDIRDREVWTWVSRDWYSRASDKAPTTGRLYHHLAILARPNALRQLFYYTKSLCVPIPFSSARESIMTLFDPILSSSNTTQHARLMQIDVAFVKAHGILFSGLPADKFKSAVDEFLGLLNNHIGRTTRRWMESGYYIAVANCCALISYGNDESVVFKLIRPQRTVETVGLATRDLDEGPGESFEQALYLAQGTYEIVFRRFADPNVLPFFHVVLVFVLHLRTFPKAMAFIEKTFPWRLVSLLLNSLLLSYRDYDRIQDSEFPKPAKELPRPLPEDFAMKGLLWAEKYFPVDWFANEKIDDDEKYFEVPSMTDERKERILWLGCRVAEVGKWLTYDTEVRQFGVLPQYDMEIAPLTKDAEDTEMINISEASETLSGAHTTNTSLKLEQDDNNLMDVDDYGDATPNKSIVIHQQ